MCMQTFVHAPTTTTTITTRSVRPDNHCDGAADAKVGEVSIMARARRNLVDRFTGPLFTMLFNERDVRS